MSPRSSNGFLRALYLIYANDRYWYDVLANQTVASIMWTIFTVGGPSMTGHDPEKIKAFCEYIDALKGWAKLALAGNVAGLGY